MYNDYLHDYSFPRRLARLARVIGRELAGRPPYGMEFGDVDAVPPLNYVREHFLKPYVNPDHVALEIGPGGGRWARYLVGFRHLYLVDYHQQILDELKRNVSGRHLTFIKNNGTDFPEVPEGSVDYLFSFGAFVHFDIPLIEGYLKNMRAILRPGGNAVIQYADQTKVMARINPGFSDNTPERMRQMLSAEGYQVLEEDLTTLWHSSVVRFTIPR
jgi:cyclopropane fatty-acyl-phospholipid synthase-like methyltransferase